MAVLGLVGGGFLGPWWLAVLGLGGWRSSACGDLVLVAAVGEVQDFGTKKQK